MSTPIAVSAEHKLISSYFEADHDRLDVLFKNFQANKRNDFSKAKPYFRDFLQGLKRHIVWEEEVLFPFFEKKSGMPAGVGPTEVMRMEHQQIGAALEAVHDRVRQMDPESDADEKKLLDILSEHNIKEENVLYPAIDQAATAEDAAEIFHAIESIPRERFAGCCGS